MKVPFVDIPARLSPYRERFHAVLQRVLDHGQAILGPEVGEVEQGLAKFVGCAHAVTVANGTDALILGLKALGVSGGEIITTPMSYLASTSSIALAGATPVFADVGSDLNLDVAAVEKAINQRTRAIQVVHLGGNPARMTELKNLADAHGLMLIEDCAQAFGASMGNNVGTLGDLGAVSFHPLKNLGAVGDAGAIFTNDAAVADQLRLARNHGHSSRDQCEFWSINSRLDSLQAGFLLAMLEEFPAVLAARRGQAALYREGLGGVVGFPTVNAGASPSYNFLYVLADRRDELRMSLAQAGIDTRIHYPLPIHRMNAARNIAPAALANTERYTQQILSLPMGPHITTDHIAYVVEKMRAFYV